MSTRPAATPMPADSAHAPARVARCRQVVMVGTSLDVRGGIAAVVRGYRDGGLFERFPITYVTTHREGSAKTKLAAALAGYGRLLRVLVSADAPLVHIHLASRASFWRKSVVCALVALWRRPYVLHVHGGDFSKFYEEECGAFSKAIVRTVLNRASRVLALSDQWRATLLRISPRARVSTLPNSVTLRSPVRANPGDEMYRVVCIGRISERKGTFDLLQAFAQIAARFDKAVLVCAGDGEGERLLALAAELGLQGRVICPGWVSAAEVAQELERATVFALPSHAEGVPMAMLEAMARGLPVVMTPVGGIPEVVQDGRNGILVPPQDIDTLRNALARLLQSAEERARLGQAAHRTIEEHFALPVTLEKLATLYREFGLDDRLR